MIAPAEGIPLNRVRADWPWSAEQRGAVRRLAREVAAFPTATALRSSAVWDRCTGAVEELLGTIQVGRAIGRPARADDGAPRAQLTDEHGTVVRAVQWNIFKGITFDAIADALDRHAALRGAEILLLNEVDVGMARSGNRHVAADLAERLGLHWAFVPSYLELTKGPGADALAPGENEVGLHGVAILTRARPLALAAILLPDIFDYFPHTEKRLGQRRGLVMSLPGDWVVGAVHLEVRNTPAARARQLAAFLDGVEVFCAAEQQAGRTVRRLLLAGDLNTHTFARGTFGRGLRGFLRLALTPRARLWSQLRRPWEGGREPLFGDLARRGLAWLPFNDDAHSAWAPIGTIEEAHTMPRLLDPFLAHVLGPDRRGLPLRLDWFLGRDVEIAGAEGPPRTLVDLLDADPAPSDHAPLVLACMR
jgi:endonuclease/exonuclease/phosphatase family metal-dependent hydrolase